MGRAPDQNGTGGDHGARRDQRALAQDAAAAEAGARHEDRAVPDLAQVADGRPDDGGAVAEDGALAYPDRMPGRADHHPVLQDGRVVADAHRSAVRPHHQALRQIRAGPDVDLTEEHRGSGDLGLGLINEKVVETHAPSPSFWPLRHLSDRNRLYARTPASGRSTAAPSRCVARSASSISSRSWATGCCRLSSALRTRYCTVFLCRTRRSAVAL